jgi:hypothetical protein
MFRFASFRAALFLLAFTYAAAQSPGEITGRWVGSIDTDQGQMEIALDVAHADGGFSGEVKSAHGGWTVTAVTFRDGRWTIAFGTVEEGGTMTGAVADGRFRGDWKTHMAVGTFELARARRR